MAAATMPDLPSFRVVPPNTRLKLEDFRLSDGTPMVGPDSLLIPPARSFSMIVNAANRIYSYRSDEAMRDNFVAARAMRRDAFIRALLEERILPTINRRWQLEVDDDTDPEQVHVRDELTKILEAIPDFDAMKRAMLDGVWFGKAGVQWAYHRDRELDGLWGIHHWDPIHGDSIQNTFDSPGIPAVLLDAMTVGWYANHGATWGQWGDLRQTDRGGTALVLHRPYWRDRFAIHVHMREKADYFEGELAGSVQGLGLRGLVYWQYVVRTDALTWMLAYMQAVGMMDMLVFNYPSGDAAAKVRAEQNAARVMGKAAFACPRSPTGNWPAVEQIPMNEAGLKALHELVAEYFDRHIERLIVGQAMSAGADNNKGFGDSGRADLSKATKDEILVYDTNRLDNTIGRDLVGPLKRYNFPWARFPVRYKSVMPDLEAKDKVANGKTLVDSGVEIKKDEWREAAGFSRPEPGDDVVGKQPAMPPGGMPGGGGPPGAPPGIGGGPQQQPPQPGQGQEPEPDEFAALRPPYGQPALAGGPNNYPVPSGTVPTAYYREGDGPGHWVTIGAQPDPENPKEKHGGTPVFIKDGKIAKGPAGLTGGPVPGGGGRSKGGDGGERPQGGQQPAQQPQQPPAQPQTSPAPPPRESYRLLLDVLNSSPLRNSSVPEVRAAFEEIESNAAREFGETRLASDTAAAARDVVNRTAERLSELMRDPAGAAAQQQRRQQAAVQAEIFASMPAFANHTTRRHPNPDVRAAADVIVAHFTQAAQRAPNARDAAAMLQAGVSELRALAEMNPAPQDSPQNKENKPAQAPASPDSKIGDAQPAGPPKKKSKAKLEIKKNTPVGRQVIAAWEQIGLRIPIDHAADLIGTMDESTTVELHPAGGARVQILAQDRRFHCYRTVKKLPDGRIEIHNDLFELERGQPKGTGIGAAIFSEQVRQAAAAGVAMITTHAAGSGRYPGGMNGYYTWARFGYNWPLESYTRNRIKRDLGKDVETVQDVMQTEEGRQWWKANGEGSTEAVFDLTPGSQSMQVMAAYLEAKAALKNPTPAPRTTPPSTPPGPNLNANAPPVHNDGGAAPAAGPAMGFPGGGNTYLPKFGGEETISTTRYSAHAPKGGIAIAGKHFIGGQFIPSEVMQQASPQERRAVEQGDARDKPVAPAGGISAPRFGDAQPALPPAANAAPAPLSYQSPAAFAASLAGAVAAGGVDPEPVRAVAAALPQGAVERLARNRLSGARAFDSTAKVADAFYAAEAAAGQPPPARRASECQGYYDPESGVLTVDGRDPAGTLAHEIGHALDQSDDRQYFDLSGSPEFMAAYAREMAAGQLSNYARTDEVEGFAEFARLVYGTPGGRETAARDFPLCYSFFQRNGLV